MTRNRGWVTSWAPSAHGIDGDHDPELSALQAALARDPSIVKAWLGPEGPGRNKYIDKCCS